MVDPKKGIKNLIAVMGPTAVGKSTVSIKLAKRFNGEIISCDSMQVYKGFDIGTDKIPEEKRENIPHHLLDIANPSSQFTAGLFVKHAHKAIELIINKNKIPIITGGTGLYFKSLFNGVFPENKKDPKIRQRLEKTAKEKGLESLRIQLKKIDPDYYEKIGKNDKIRIIRALEVYQATQKSLSEHFLKTKSKLNNYNIIKIGLKLNRQLMYKRIEERIDSMFERGIIEEVQKLLEKGLSEHLPPFRALGYQYIVKMLHNQISREEALSLFKRDTRHYAKRQITWFKKMEGIKWFSPSQFDSIAKYIENNLK
ncbi:MAG: tRNA (adenosine(37)-N6)-dimethylallyltransferase MiaA [Candidatus Aminicenantaceae bacterium]